MSDQQYAYVRTSGGCVWRRRLDGTREFTVLTALNRVSSISAGLAGLSFVSTGVARRYPDPVIDGLYTVPTPIPDARVIVAGLRSMCAIVQGGQIRCSGAFGTAEPYRHLFAPTTVPGVTNVAWIGINQGAGYFAAQADGRAFYWLDPYQPAPRPALDGVLSDGGNFDHRCFVMRDRSVRCAGENTWNVCGTTERRVYTIEQAQVIAGLTDITQVAAAHRTTEYALRSDGRLLRWGKIRESTTVLPVGSPTPELVPDLTDVVRIGGGEADLLAVRRDGSLWSIHLPTEDGFPRLERVPGFGPTP